MTKSNSLIILTTCHSTDPQLIIVLELLFRTGYLIILIQASAIRMRLLLVIMTRVLIFIMIKSNLIINLIGFIVLMLFVGGLLILLVRVSTLSFQDQIMSVIIRFIVIVVIILVRDNLLILYIG